MAEALTCKVVTPVNTVFDSEATYVGLPGEMGSFGVMRRHEPLVSALNPGVVNVDTAGEGSQGRVRFVISGGYAQIDDDKVIVLANDALDVSKIDRDAVSANLEKVEKDLAAAASDDSSAAYYRDLKAWLELQLKVIAQ